jgi:hypothetical protein
MVRAEIGKRGEIIARFSSARPARVVNPLASREIRRCKSCGVRKLLALGFYRHRTGRGGYRAECKKCRNRQRAAWARARYVPRTGRRYVTKADRAARAEAASDARDWKG